MGFGELPGAVHRIAAPGRASGANHPQDAHVVFDGGDARLGAVPDHGLQRLDIAIPFGTLRQHDRGVFFAIDVTRLQERRGGAIDADAAAAGEIDHAVQLFDRRVDTISRDLWVTADVAYAVACQVFEVGFVGGSRLVTQLHEGWFGGCRGGSWMGGVAFGGKQPGGAGPGNKVSSVHFLRFISSVRGHPRGIVGISRPPVQSVPRRARLDDGLTI